MDNRFLSGLDFDFFSFSIPSYLDSSLSFIKSVFVLSIVSVILMLWKLNHLTFFEEMIGKSSAEDVLKIMNNER